eukprot:NODE_495_length_6825_cov_1.481267.p5 type:complete len:120 gc:universal NODE_495_length_6825_cov_1.481267:5327-5686(+)
MKQRPNLHKQEATSIMCLISILLKLITANPELENRTAKVIERLISTYLSAESKEEKRGKNAVKPAIELVLDYFTVMADEIFDRIGKSMFRSFILIAKMENDEILRIKVCDVLDRYFIYL